MKTAMMTIGVCLLVLTYTAESGHTIEKKQNFCQDAVRDANSNINMCIRAYTTILTDSTKACGSACRTLLERYADECLPPGSKKTYVDAYNRACNTATGGATTPAGATTPSASSPTKGRDNDKSGGDNSSALASGYTLFSTVTACLLALGSALY